MEFLKKLYHVKISGKKSVANHKQPTISNSHLLSDYSDDEESIPVISYRQKNTAKRSQSRKKDQKIKQTLLSFSTIDSKQDQNIPVHTRDEKEKSSNNDQKVN